jgi:hypothetical protein
LNNITKIIGPISWSYYNINGKKIHIFGSTSTDDQNNESKLITGNNSNTTDNCIAIESLLSCICDQAVRNLSQTNIFVNSFCDKKYNKYELHQDVCFLDRLNFSYIDCLLSSKTSQNISPFYPYAKYHHSNIINKYSKSATFLSMVSDIVKSLDTYLLLSKLDCNTKQHYYDKISQILFIVRTIIHLIENDINLFFDIYVLDENGIDMLKNVIITTRIEEYMNNHQLYDIFNDNNSHTSKIFDKLSNLNNPIKNHIINYFQKKYHKDVDALLMFKNSDIYTKVINDDISFTIPLIKNFVATINALLLDINSDIINLHLLVKLFIQNKDMNVIYVDDCLKNIYDDFLTNEMNTHPIYEAKNKVGGCVDSRYFNNTFNHNS